ncbi:MAG: methyltransferase [Meiothermus sp.]|nr:methyltransferase [Meiothermus sp.]
MNDYHALRSVPLAGGSLMVKGGVRGFPDPQYDLLARRLEPFGTHALDLNPGAGVVTLALVRHGLSVGALETSRAAQRCLEASFANRVHLEMEPPWQTRPDCADLVAMVLPANRGTRYVEASLWGASNALRTGGRLWISGAKDKGFEGYFKAAQELLGFGTLVAKDGPYRLAVLEKEKPTPPAPELWVHYTTEVDGRPYTFHSLPGVFSGTHLDPGTRMLLEHLPDRMGQVLELGAGGGALALPLMHKCQGLTLLEDDLVSVLSLERSISSALPSLPSSLTPPTVIHSDVDFDLTKNARFNTIVSNPPFHVGGLVVLDTARAFLHAAQTRLERGGEFYLVANRFLPYEPLLEQGFTQVRTLAVNSHKVLCAVK